MTGAGQGIGAGIASHLGARGAAVLVNDIVAERAEATAESIREQGARADALPCDVTRREAVEEALAGRAVDVVVNNAGNAGAHVIRPTPFCDMDPADWAAPIDVNLHGVMHTTHAVLAGMRERRFGRLITIASAAGVVGSPIGVAPYGAGKAGAMSFMRHIAIENAALGVTANSFALGLMEMTGVQDPKLLAQLASTVPCGRLGTGNDIGPACVWLASDEAGFITGITLPIDGGTSAQ